jgi:hypothetical protein
MNVEAIVCTVTLDLDEYGNLSQKIFDIGKEKLRRDLFKIKESLPNNRLLSGQATSLVCKSDYHIGNFERLIFVAVWDYQSEYNLNLFYKAYINSLREAFQHNIRSIALPIMAYDGNLRLCGQAIVKVIKDLDNLKISSEFSIEEIYFVSNNSDHITYLKKEVKPKLS